MKHSRDTKSTLLRVLLYVLFILVVLITLYPYFVMFTYCRQEPCRKSTQPREHFSRSTGSGRNFKDIWTLAPLSRYFINSLVVAGGSTLIAIVCGIPAAMHLHE